MIKQRNIIRVSCEEICTLCIHELKTIDGKTYFCCYYDDKAMPIAGFLPIRKSIDAEETIYINADQIASITIDDDNAGDMRRDMLALIEKRVSER